MSNPLTKSLIPRILIKEYTNLADATLKYYMATSSNTVYHQKCLAKRCPFGLPVKNQLSFSLFEGEERPNGIQ